MVHKKFRYKRDALFTGVYFISKFTYSSQKNRVSIATTIEDRQRSSDITRIGKLVLNTGIPHIIIIQQISKINIRQQNNVLTKEPCYLNEALIYFGTLGQQLKQGFTKFYNQDL